MLRKSYSSNARRRGKNCETHACLFAESRAKPGRDVAKDIALYQPADWNDIDGRGSYDVPNGVNDTTHLNSVSRQLNSTMTSSAQCHCCFSRVIINCIIAAIALLLTSSIL